MAATCSLPSRGEGKKWQPVYLGLRLKTYPYYQPHLPFVFLSVRASQASNSRDCSVPMGRRLLKWPCGAPSIAVQRQLGWLDLWPARLMSAAGLWARCLCLPSSCPAARVARFAVTQASSWAAAIQTELQQIGVPDPSCCGIAPTAPRTVTHRWSAPMVTICKTCHLQSFVHSVSGRRAKHRFIVAVLVTGRRRHTCTRVYGQQTCPLRARAWGLARCGHHDFSDGRTPFFFSPSRTAEAARPLREHPTYRESQTWTPCRFCAVGMDSLEHALLNCSAH